MFFFAGFLASYHLVARFFGQGEKELKAGACGVYRILLVALFFCFLGTMLGGIWADMSWGRFWGWDPKENGALMTLLWCSCSLHARLLHVCSCQGFLVLASLGNIVAAWGWFGVGTHKRLADVPFRITSKTTGESHIVVTDDNGQFSTSAEWASHKHNTNAGKTSEDGVWFGTSEPDDSKGALPYDTYIIEELRSDSNKGFELIPPFEIVVSRNNLVIDLGTLTDEYEKEITIHTTATSKDGEKTILAGKEVTIVDTVKLDGLKKGTKYQLVGWQMLKEENAELIIDGKRVENDYTFVADDEAMKVEIAYTFNASELGGKNLVTFEELYDVSNPDEPVKVAEHKDIEDDGQTVLITERIIKIHTTATDKDGNKEIEAGKDVTIVDTVTLEGLEIGTKYQLKGWQMLKEENAELLINGKRVESDYTFTADSETMKVEVAFTFDATSLDGKQLVTFEELYDFSNPDEPKKVTEHKDIDDEGQTITFKEKPEVPEEPEKPETPQTPDTPKKTDSPKTGDSTNLYGLLALLLTSGAGMAGTYLYKRRKVKKS